MPINRPDVFNVVGDAVVTGGGGGGAVSDVTGTTPISVSPTTGNVVVSLNTTGVVSHDTQPTLSADLDLNSNAIVASNNNNGAKLEYFANNIILSSAAVGTIWNAYTNSNLFAIGQPTIMGGPTGVASTDKIAIKSANSTSAIKVQNASNTEVFNLEMDGAGSIELNMPTGKVAVENLTLGASGTTYNFPNAVGSTGEVLKVNGSNLEFGTVSGGVTAVTGTSPIVSSGGTTPNITHADSGVTADTYKKATIVVNAKGHVTSATPGTDLITMRGETDTDWSARATWFVSPNWRSGTAKETGLSTVTLSGFDEWTRYPIVNFNEQFDGKIEVEGYLLMGPGVPATKANYRISVWSATATTNDTSETFTKVLESGNLTAGNSNSLTVIPKTTLTYTASAGDYLLIGLGNVSSTIALSTGMCYANLNVRFQNL